MIELKTQVGLDMPSRKGFSAIDGWFGGRGIDQRIAYLGRTDPIPLFVSLIAVPMSHPVASALVLRWSFGQLHLCETISLLRLLVSC